MGKQNVQAKEVYWVERRFYYELGLTLIFYKNVEAEINSNFKSLLRKFPRWKVD